MSCVFPGEDEILASPFLLVSILISEDFPTLLRPINAYSGRSGFGHCVYSALLMTYLASLIFMGVQYTTSSLPLYTCLNPFPTTISPPSVNPKKPKRNRLQKCSTISPDGTTS